MTMDLTGATLANLIVPALGVPTPPTNPTPDQYAAYESALAAQVATWTIICNQILSYVSSNATLTIPATGIDDSGGRACTGSSTTGTIT